jgi:UDP-glucuronate 4-epimerase
MKVLITGAAGFIGFHLTKKLVRMGCSVVGLDNINEYYDSQLKFDRLAQLGIEKEQILWNGYTSSNLHSNYSFIRLDLVDRESLSAVFLNNKFDTVVNLAAQAGVRYSISNPDSYIQSNMVGFFNLLEVCRSCKIKHLVHASSSSVYGLSNDIPFSEEDKADRPVSLYAATKRSNELMAHSYSHLYGLRISCLRFFTVYGEWGRPDMAPMLFATAICRNEPIKMFNSGEMLRDFTYVGDTVEGISSLLFAKVNSDNLFNVFNLGNGSPVHLNEFISLLEKEFKKEAKKINYPMQPGDVYKTWANNNEIQSFTGFRPSIPIEVGVKSFADWFKSYYTISDTGDTSRV